MAGHYLLYWGIQPEGLEYAQPDMRTAWYNRKLRIFANLQQVITAPEDRVLLIIGNGHAAILDHLAEAHPLIEVVPVASVLGR